MGGIGLSILLFALISGIQVFLSLRKSKYLGLLIPGLNALGATRRLHSAVTSNVTFAFTPAKNHLNAHLAVKLLRNAAT